MILGYLLVAIARLLNFALGVYMLLIFIRALLSWFDMDPYSKLMRTLVNLTEPCLRPIRKIIMPLNIGLDLSPVVTILLIMVVKAFLISTLLDIADKLR